MEWLAIAATVWAGAHGGLLVWHDLGEFRLPDAHVLGLGAALVCLRVALGNPEAFHGGAGYDLSAPALVLGLWAWKIRRGLGLGGGDLKVLGVGALSCGFLGLWAMVVGACAWAGAVLAWVKFRLPRMSWGGLKTLRIPLGPGLCLGIWFFVWGAFAFPQVPGEVPGAAAPKGLQPGLEGRFLGGDWDKILGSTRIQSLECPRQPVADLVRGLGSRAGLVFLCDASVHGEAAWFFPEGSLYQALQAFMVSQGLFVRLEGGLPLFSRLGLEARGPGRFALDCQNLSARLVLSLACKTAQVSVLGLEVPENLVSIHGFEGTMEDFLPLVLPGDGSLRVRREGPAWFVEKAPLSKTGSLDKAEKPEARLKLERAGVAWNLDVERSGLDSVIRELARQGGFEYLFVQKPQQVLEDIHLTGLGLDEVLDLVCGQGGFDWEKEETGPWRFFEAGRKDLLKKPLDFEMIYCRNLGVQDLLQLVPVEFANLASWRVDKASNALVLYGSRRERDLLRPVLLGLDKPAQGREWKTFVLKNLGVKDALGRLPGEFPPGEALVIENRNAFMMRLSPLAAGRLEAFLAELDQAASPLFVKLKYLSPEDVLALLPAGFARSDLSPGRNNTLYYTGPAGRFGELQATLALMDVPEPQIRYQILVVEYQEHQSMSLSPGLGLRPTDGSKDSENIWDALALSLGESFNVAFDIIGGFGATFAASLDAKLSQKRARIMTDTSIQGLSGQELKFQNTQTYRIAETETDPDTGEVRATGVTREVTSGLFLGIKGNVSGDGMITMNLSATLSERGGDESDASGTNPLSTSERMVNTRVRTRSGQALVVGGLVKSHSAQNQAGTPVLSEIPVLGALFGSSAPVREYGEVCIYLLPWVEYGLADVDQEALDLEEFHRRFAGVKDELPKEAVHG